MQKCCVACRNGVERLSTETVDAFGSCVLPVSCTAVMSDGGRVVTHGVSDTTTRVCWRVGSKRAQQRELRGGALVRGGSAGGFVVVLATVGSAGASSLARFVATRGRTAVVVRVSMNLN